MILTVNIKVFSHLKATMLPYCVTASLEMFMVAVKSTDTPSFRILSCRNSSSTKTSDSRSFLYSLKCDQSISLFSTSSALNTFLNSFRGRPRPTKETLLLSLTKSPYATKFCFSVRFLSFFRFFFFFVCLFFVFVLLQI